MIFLQQVAGYNARQAGLATLPSTLMMFLLSKRAGRLADRYGPRLFMGLGPIVSALGLALHDAPGRGLRLLDGAAARRCSSSPPGSSRRSRR